MKKSKDFIFYFLLFISCVILRLFFTYKIFPPTCLYEEAQNGGIAYIKSFFPLFRDQEFLFSIILTKLSFTLANIFKSFSLLLSLRFFFVVAGIISLIFYIYTLKKLEVSKFLSLIFAIIFATSPFLIHASSIADESLFAINIAIIIFLTMLLLYKKPTFLNYLLIFLLFAISFYEYISVKLFMVFNFLTLCILTLRNIKNSRRVIFYFLIGLIIFSYITYPYWFSKAFWDGPNRHLEHGNASIINEGWKNHFDLYYTWFFQQREEILYHDLFTFFVPKTISLLYIASFCVLLLFTIFSSNIVLITNLALAIFTIVSSALIAYNCDIKRIMPCIFVLFFSFPFAIDIVIKKYNFKILKIISFLCIIPILAFSYFGIIKEIKYEKTLNFSSEDSRNYYICSKLNEINTKINNKKSDNIIIHPFGLDIGEGCTNDFLWISKINPETKIIKDSFDEKNIAKDKIYYFISIENLDNILKDKLPYLENDLKCDIHRIKINQEDVNLIYFNSSTCFN